MSRSQWPATPTKYAHALAVLWFESSVEANRRFAYRSLPLRAAGLNVVAWAIVGAG